jgi:carbonic anhydrase/acetyltransferase-like protein (isoleucine patch superfamily)
MIKIHESAYIDKHAVLYGNIEIGKGSSVWPNAVLRAEKNPIKIGKNSNVQDNVVIHTDDRNGVEIGDNVSIGHGAILHSCTIKNNCIIGMGAIVMANVIIEENCIIGAGALVTEGKTISKNSLVIGIPAKVDRKLNEEEIKSIIKNARGYVNLSREYFFKKRREIESKEEK